MNIRAFFIPQGFMIGDLLKTSDDGEIFTVKNPCLIVQRGDKPAIAPMLVPVEEDTVEIRRDLMTFNTSFTPNKDLVDAYTSIFGGIIVPNRPSVLGAGAGPTATASLS